MIPDDVRRFVLTSIPSVPYLEAALLLRRLAPREHSDEEVARALYIPRARAAELLEAMHQAGVVALRRADNLHARYEPRDPELVQAFDRLARHYEADIVGITHLIHDASGKSAMRFADAFKIRKDS
ncbi:MAG: hypothetical protein KIT60_18890 [Burkholderiaceae bacterium]|nr:hypothetical protein [Burkholderiaceae bacterium]